MDAPQWLVDGAHQVFEWIGFGFVVGIAARAIMPGKDPDSAGATLVTGAGGAVLGCGTLALFMPEHRITPLSLGGFLAAVAGGFCLLAFYRLLAGRVKIVRNASSVVEQAVAPKRTRRRRAAQPAAVED